jgi:hypothetical protein
MKSISLRFFSFLLAGFLLVSCEKEYSLENEGFSMTALGSLVDSLGNCKQITVSGTYKVDVPLTTSNNLGANVNFIKTGKYKISSDTVNGMWFQDSGFVLNTGAVKVSVKGYGKPLLPKTSVFTLRFNGTSCSFLVTASGSGGGGGGGGGDDYFPTSKASNWTYKYEPKIGSLDTFRVTVAEETFTIDSLEYFQFARSTQDTFYFAKNSSIGNYYALSTIDFDYVFLFDSVPSYFITYPFLKERAAVNESWETQEYGIVKLVTGGVAELGVTKAIFTILSKNSVPYTIGGNTYQNVIAVKREIQFKSGVTFRTVTSGISYYAKGYGLIDQVIGVVPNSLSIPITRQPTIY